MFDNRWPHMIPLDGRHVPGLDVLQRRAANRIGRAIASRTQTVPFFNLNTGGIFFARGQTPQMGPYEMPFLDSKLPEPHEVDHIVSYMNLALVPSDTKERWANAQEKRQKHEQEEKRGKGLEDRRHEIENYAEFVSRKRRGTQTLVKVL